VSINTALISEKLRHLNVVPAVPRPTELGELQVLILGNMKWNSRQ